MRVGFVLMAVVALAAPCAGAQERITILRDAFGAAPPETILKAATPAGSRVRLLTGGFHWVTTPAAEIRRMALALRDEFNVISVAPGHCTGETAFKELQSAFGNRYVYAGVGTIISLEPSR